MTRRTQSRPLTDDLSWILRAIESALVDRARNCHVHHPVAPETPLPPELEHLIDERVTVSRQGPSAGMGTGPGGEWASD